MNQIKKIRHQLKQVSGRLKQGNIDDLRMSTNYKLIFKEINFIDSIVLNNVQLLRDNDMLIKFLESVYQSLLDMDIDKIKGTKQTIDVNEELQSLKTAEETYRKHDQLINKHKRYYGDVFKPLIKE